MMKTQEQLKMSIMGRVYMAYAMRRVFRSQTIRMALGIGSLATLVSFVSVLNVLHNMPSPTHVRTFYHFSISAFSNTDLTVQLTLLVFLGALMWYAVDLVKQLSPSHSHSRIYS